MPVLEGEANGTEREFIISVLGQQRVGGDMVQTSPSQRYCPGRHSQNTVLTSLTKQHCSHVILKTTVFLRHLQHTVVMSFTKHRSGVIHKTLFCCHSQNKAVFRSIKKHHYSDAIPKTLFFRHSHLKQRHSSNTTILTSFSKHFSSVTHDR